MISLYSISHLKMKWLEKSLVLFTVLVFLTTITYSQTNSANESQLELKNPEGKEFWLTFMRNHNNPPPGPNSNNLSLELFITSDYNSEVVIEIPGIGYREVVEVPANTVRNIIIDPAAQITTSEVVEENMAVHIVASEPVTIYGLNRRKQTTDTFLGLPVEVIGSVYRAICYNVSQELMSQFAIVATEDQTTVTIVPATNTSGGRQRGKAFNITLNKGDVYQVSALNSKRKGVKDDLTGTVVTADKKISFFSGHQCAYVPDGVIACNHLVEQLPPLSSWGRNYYLGELKSRSKSTYRVLADQDGTRVFEDAQFVIELKAGQYYEKMHSKPVQITSNKPVLVAQYSQGNKNGDAIGDPMMLLISPTQQFLKKYRFATPVNGFWEHYINIVIPTTAIPTLRLDQRRVDPKYFQKIGLSRYSIGYISVSFGTHEISAAEKFGLTSYGFGYDKDQYDAYGNISGQSFVEYKVQPDEMPPELEIGAEGNSIIVRDDRDNDQGISSIQVISTNNIDISVPIFTQGAPQVNVTDIKSADIKNSKALIEVSDVSGNIALYTLCYTLDPNSASFVYSLSAGDQACQSYLGVNVTAFAGYSMNIHSAGASALPDRIATTELNSISGFNASFGLEVGRSISENLEVAVRGSYLPGSGGLSIIDSASESYYFDRSTGQPESINERYELNAKNSFAFELSADYLVLERLKLGLGLGVLIGLSDAPYSEKYISSPPNGVYSGSDSDREDVYLEQQDIYNTLLPFISVDISYERPLLRNWSFVPEIRYLYTLTSPIEGSDWQVNSIIFNLGFRFKL